MGYLTRFDGFLTFSRPLMHGEVHAVPDDDDLYLFGLEVFEDEEETDQGRIISKASEGIEVKVDDRCKGYDCEEQLQRIINALPPDVVVRGEIRCDGEDTGDVSRLVVHDRKVVREVPRLIWPDGSEERSRRH